MTATITGIVREGMVVPSIPIPEGTHVEIHMFESLTDIPPELMKEMMAWQQGSAEALAVVERNSSKPIAGKGQDKAESRN